MINKDQILKDIGMEADDWSNAASDVRRLLSLLHIAGYTIEKREAPLTKRVQDLPVWDSSDDDVYTIFEAALKILVSPKCCTVLDPQQAVEQAKTLFYLSRAAAKETK